MSDILRRGRISFVIRKEPPSRHFVSPLAFHYEKEKYDVLQHRSDVYTKFRGSSIFFFKKIYSLLASTKKKQRIQYKH